MLKEACAWPSAHGDLTSWAEQGVLLLNVCLTVREGASRSHAGLGWERFTNGIVEDLSNYAQRRLIFLLWGRDAQSKGHLVDGARHEVLATGHPSPLARGAGFIGCDHFTRANAFLIEAGEAPIRWTLC